MQEKLLLVKYIIDEVGDEVGDVGDVDDDVGDSKILQNQL